MKLFCVHGYLSVGLDGSMCRTRARGGQDERKVGQGGTMVDESGREDTKSSHLTEMQLRMR